MNNGRDKEGHFAQMTDKGHTFMFGSLRREKLFSFRDSLA